MSIIGGSSSGHLSKPWQSRAWVQLLAVMLGPLPVYAMLSAKGLLSDQPDSPRDFILYSTVISGPIIIVLLLLFRYLCGENPRELNLKPGRWTSDLLAAGILSVVPGASNLIITDRLKCSCALNMWGLSLLGQSASVFGHGATSFC